MGPFLMCYGVIVTVKELVAASYFPPPNFFTMQEVMAYSL
jgi:histidinol phosphatase-like enzyme